MLNFFIKRYVLTLVFITIGGQNSYAQVSQNQRPSTSEISANSDKLKQLEDAFKKLKENNTSSNPTARYDSLDYWASIHGYYGSGINASASNLENMIQRNCGSDSACRRSYDHLKSQTPPSDGFSSEVWGTCQHGENRDDGWSYFLPWHRMYLYYFEKSLSRAVSSIQTQSNTQNFMLPFWNYLDEKFGTSWFRIPSIVRNNSNSALYNEWRSANLNSSRASSTSSIANSTASASQAFRVKDFYSFQEIIDASPHGQMHCAVGSGCRRPDMGLVPFAGLDPLFYMHHANIDRIWWCWMNQKSKGSPIDITWAQKNLTYINTKNKETALPNSWFNKTFTFLDYVNGSYTAVNVAVKDLFDPSKPFVKMGYSNCNNVPTISTKLSDLERTLKSNSRIAFLNSDKGQNNNSNLKNLYAQNNGQKIAAMSRAPIVLKGASTTIPMFESARGVFKEKQSLARSRLAKSIPGYAKGNDILILENITLTEKIHPDLSYNIMIRKKNSDKEEFVDILPVFQLTANFGTDDDTPIVIETLTFDVTEELQKINVNSYQDVSIRFVPTDDYMNGKTSVQARNDASKITISTIYLQQAEEASSLPDTYSPQEPLTPSPDLPGEQ